MSAEREPRVLRSRARVRGCAGKTTGSSSRLRPSTMRASRGCVDVRLAVDGGDDVACPGSCGGRIALARERGEAAGSRRPSRRRRPRSGRRRPRARACRASARPGRRAARRAASTSIRLRSSGIVRSPLRRPASTCATGRRRAGRARAGERRVRVAVDEHEVGRLRARRPAAIAGLHRVHVGGAEVEPVARLGEPELLEEDRRQLGVPVLAGVDDDLLDRRPRAARPTAAPT